MADVRNTLVSQNLTALCSNPSGSQESIGALRALDQISAELARDATLRETIVQPPLLIWESLRETWKTLSNRDIDVLLEDSSQTEQTVCVARFTRNLVAGTPDNQREVLYVLRFGRFLFIHVHVF